MKVLVGSRALKHHFPDFRRQPPGKARRTAPGGFEKEWIPKDTDYLSDEQVDGADTFWHPDLTKWSWGEIATVDELYTIKVSHAFWDIRGSWNKHMMDVVFLQNNGAVFIRELYDILYPIWEETHGKKQANLEASPEEFFNSRVHRIYDHDSIHESVAYYDRPLFESILRDGHQVAVDRAKFDALTEEDKHRLVREEVYATALERELIPKGYQGNPRIPYMTYLHKTVTSFSKGWFPLYIVLNFNKLYFPDVNYVDRHLNNKHKLRPFGFDTDSM